MIKLAGKMKYLLNIFCSQLAHRDIHRVLFYCSLTRETRVSPRNFRSHRETFRLFHYRTNSPFSKPTVFFFFFFFIEFVFVEMEFTTKLLFVAFAPFSKPLSISIEPLPSHHDSRMIFSYYCLNAAHLSQFRFHQRFESTQPSWTIWRRDAAPAQH